MNNQLMGATMLMLMLMPFWTAAAPAAAAAAAGCCAPDQWESRISNIFSGVGPYSESEAHASFDFTNQLAAVNQTTTGDSAPTLRQRIVIDGKAGKTYVVNADTGVCQILPAQKLERTCVPANFKLIDQFHLGMPSEKLDVVAFLGQAQGLNVTLAVSKAACMPVTTVVKGMGVLQTEFIYDATPGIKDRSVFRIPPSCKQQQQQQQQQLRLPVLSHRMPMTRLTAPMHL